MKNNEIIVQVIEPGEKLLKKVENVTFISLPFLLMLSIYGVIFFFNKLT